MPKPIASSIIADSYAALAKGTLEISKHLPENSPERQRSIELAKHYQELSDRNR